ncbi:MAG: dihydrofolate reductase, partial [Actinomycetia bacterium]|nr:dihydrofolate reductase [Actinomycetes bacterium]
GVLPGQVVKVRRTDDGVMVGSGMEYAELNNTMASHVFVAVG